MIQLRRYTENSIFINIYSLFIDTSIYIFTVVTNHVYFGNGILSFHTFHLYSNQLYINKGFKTGFSNTYLSLTSLLTK